MIKQNFRFEIFNLIVMNYLKLRSVVESWVLVNNVNINSINN